MTIDEAIKHAREVAEHKREMAEGVWKKKLNKPDFPWGRDYTKEEVERNEKECVLCAEEHEQLAVWLEELKTIKDGAVFYSNKPIEDIVLEARADAFDEMVDFFDNKSICTNNECIHMNDECSCVRCIAEQLKELKNE